MGQLQEVFCVTTKKLKMIRNIHFAILVIIVGCCSSRPNRKAREYAYPQAPAPAYKNKAPAGGGDAEPEQVSKVQFVEDIERDARQSRAADIPVDHPAPAAKAPVVADKAFKDDEIDRKARAYPYATVPAAPVADSALKNKAPAAVEEAEPYKVHEGKRDARGHPYAPATVAVVPEIKTHAAPAEPYKVQDPSTDVRD